MSVEASLDSVSTTKMLRWRDSAVALGLFMLGLVVLYSLLFLHVLTVNVNSSWIFDWADHIWFLAIPLIWYFALKRRFPVGKLSGNSLRRWLPGWIIMLAIAVPFAILTSQKTSLAGVSSLAIVMNVLFNGVIVGVSEEFLFRGQVQTGLNNSVEKIVKLGKGSIRLGTILAGVVFAAIHLVGNVSAIPFAFVFGIVVGYYYDKTNNIWGAVIIHNIVDLLSFLIPIIL
jgi:membrane protease YdiL (CAAX protease family)